MFHTFSFQAAFSVWLLFWRQEKKKRKTSAWPSTHLDSGEEKEKKTWEGQVWDSHAAYALPREESLLSFSPDAAFNFSVGHGTLNFPTYLPVSLLSSTPPPSPRHTFLHLCTWHGTSLPISIYAALTNYSDLLFRGEELGLGRQGHGVWRAWHAWGGDCMALRPHHLQLCTAGQTGMAAGRKMSPSTRLEASGAHNPSILLCISIRSQGGDLWHVMSWYGRDWEEAGTCPAAWAGGWALS